MNPRSSLERLIDPQAADTLAEDVLRGLFTRPKRLPPKHFYDAAGGAIFEEICALPEYYPTRTEAALLREIAPRLVESLRPENLVELGSGSSNKTRILLEALGKLGRGAEYHPIDIDETSLVESARRLVAEHPWLSVHARVADYERPLPNLPRGRGTLLAFLGSTVGNLEAEEARRLLEKLSREVGPGASLLLGVDRVKDPWRIARAYDDPGGVTARFNLNLLNVINRKLRAAFDPADFRHLAFYDRAREQVEMHLVARRRLEVPIAALGRAAAFEPGETVRTEISRKFTPESARAMVEGAGWHLEYLFSDPAEDFSLLWCFSR